MKKVIAILILVFTVVSVVACGTPSDNSNVGFDDSISEIVRPEDSNEKIDDSEETEGEEKEPESENESNNGGNVVKPITGGGDFNAGNDY